MTQWVVFWVIHNTEVVQEIQECGYRKEKRKQQGSTQIALEVAYYRALSSKPLSLDPSKIKAP